MNQLLAKGGVILRRTQREGEKLKINIGVNRRRRTKKKKEETANLID